jgi:hypothetical protein
MNAYPLLWPEGWPRTHELHRTDGRFNKKESRSGSSYRSARGLTVADGVQRVVTELERFGIDRQDVIISTNVRTRLDGLPRSGEREPSDGGAAVYWQDRARARRVIAIDRYTTVADNLAAIAATLDAMRAIERHGGARILERAFTGFTALPPPGAQGWRQVMGLDATENDLAHVRAAYRRLAAERHPDRPTGSHNGMAELNSAMAAAERELIACAG